MLYAVRDGRIVELSSGREINLAEEEERLDRCSPLEEYRPTSIDRMVIAVLDESRSQINSWGRM
jgi:hypothetical protein